MEKDRYNILSQCLTGFSDLMKSEALDRGKLLHLLKDDVLIREGQYVKALPVVLNGSVKVCSSESEKQFLLYYLHSGDTCVLSFSCLLSEEPCSYTGIAETSCDVLMIPLDIVREWMESSVHFNRLLIRGYQRHSNDMLETTKQLICYDLEERLKLYLEQKSIAKGENKFMVSHKEIAEDLATSREVITRLLKKLEINGFLSQVSRHIQLVR